MDEHRFDDWARALADSRSRRGVMAALVSSLMAAIGIDGTAAAGGNRRRRGTGNSNRRDRGPGGKQDHGQGHGGENGVIAQKGGKGKGRKNNKKKRDNKPKPPPKHPCQSDGDCGACGTCGVNGFCQPQDSRCIDCQTCNPRTFTCLGGCHPDKVCCDGTCQTPGPQTCCTRSDQCGPEWGCLWCDGGTCVPVPDGRECKDCKRCKAGVCIDPDPNRLCGGVCCQDDEVCVGIVIKECCAESKACDNYCCQSDEICGPDEECCKACGTTCCNPETHICRNPQTDDCCPRCENNACCPGGQGCVDTGVLGSRFCCDKPCGKQADGTYEECCNPGETCADDVCCPNERVCNGHCCRDDQKCDNGICKPRCGRNRDIICPSTHQCVDDGVDRFCCPVNSETRQACGRNDDGTAKFCCQRPQTVCTETGPKGYCSECGLTENGLC